MEKEKKQANTVKALANKLQLGWSMLALTCPQCNTPLMREKGSQRIYCVSCQLWVVREEDIEAEKRASQQGSSTVAHDGAPTTSNSNSNSLQSSYPSAQSNKPPSEKTIEELEAGLASLSSHRQYHDIRSALKAENDGESDSKTDRDTHDDGDDDGDEEGVDSDDAYIDLGPSKSALSQQAKLAEYSRAREAEKQAALAAEIEEFNGPTVSQSEIDAHMSRVDALSSKLGAKMLAGWALLADSCPEPWCGCPLMRERGEKVKMHCVNCGCVLTKDEGEDEMKILEHGKKEGLSKTTHATVSQSKPSPSSSLTSRPSSQKQQFLNKSTSLRSTRRQRFDDSDDSDHDADPTVDDEVNDFVPSPNGASIHSQSHQQLPFDVKDPYKLSNIPNDFSDESFSSFASSSRNAAVTGVSSSEDPSAKLGEKMLQGYALLAKHCPRDNCNCPLVRKKDGPMLCVKCGSTIVDEDEYDESIHGKAENLSQTKSPSQTGSSSSFVGSPHLKRHASPSLNELRESEHSTAKKDASKSPAFQSSLGLSSPLSRGDSHGDGSANSSGLPSPTGAGNRSRTWSIEFDGSIESAVDPRLRQQAQLGGMRGRFNAPHSRANSLAVGAPQSIQSHHTSSAALNAVAQMTLTGGSQKRVQLPPRHSNHSGQSSVEQSPKISTPPQTPLNMPSFALTSHSSSVSGQMYKYPQSRHPSINLGGPSQPTPSTAFAHSPTFGQFNRASVMIGSPQPLAASSPNHQPHLSPLQQQHHASSASKAIPSFHLTPSIDLPAPSLTYSSVINSTLDSLIHKLHDCQSRLGDADIIQTRDIVVTMREIMLTMEIAKGFSQQ